jgi:spermidine synthase
MALLWSKTVKGTRYEVRTAGRTRRLYENGVFHSQYNERTPITGSVWDLLSLPAFFFPEGIIRRVLVLGVGGGAVISQLQRFVRPDVIIGVDYSPVHLYLGRRFFGLDQSGVELVESDAAAWLQNYTGPKFDMIIDDLFGEQDGEPVRGVDADASWFNAQIQHLAPRGIMVTNFDTGHSFRESGYFTQPQVAARFKTAFWLGAPRIQNAVGVFSRSTVTSADLRREIKRVDELRRAESSGKLSYRIQRIV